MAKDNICVITFPSTHLALQFEREAKQAGLAARLIPVPRQLSASCGLAGRFAESVVLAVLDLCKQKGIRFEHIYRTAPHRSDGYRLLQ